MNIAITIILGYAGLLLLCWAIIWWAIKQSQKNKPCVLCPQTHPDSIVPSQRDPEDTNLSVDVFLVDANGMMFVGFYDHKELGWIFIHDKFQPKGNFVWMYKPKRFMA